MKPGTRVVLDSPQGELRRGKEAGALLRIPNGSKGVVVGSGVGARADVVTFDDIGGTVGVSVPMHWLKQDTGE